MDIKIKNNDKLEDVNTIYIGVNGKQEKIYENGTILNEELFETFIKQHLRMSQSEYLELKEKFNKQNNTEIENVSRNKFKKFLYKLLKKKEGR